MIRQTRPLGFGFRQLVVLPDVREHAIELPPPSLAARCRVESMPGTPAAPIGPAMQDRKLAECFGSGAKALDTARVQILSERISRLESLPDMGAFFDGILAARITQ